MAADTGRRPSYADRLVELRAQRRSDVAGLRNEGLSIRGIADALGVSVGQVAKDLRPQHDESEAA
jgi:DNA-directed RNA polymerase specialized sigma24 family protein